MAGLTGSATMLEVFIASASGTMTGCTGASAFAEVFKLTVAGTMTGATGAAALSEVFTVTASGSMTGATGASTFAEVFSIGAAGTMTGATGASTFLVPVDIDFSAAGTMTGLTGSSTFAVPVAETPEGGSGFARRRRIPIRFAQPTIKLDATGRMRGLSGASQFRMEHDFRSAGNLSGFSGATAMIPRYRGALQGSLAPATGVARFQKFDNLTPEVMAAIMEIIE